MRLNGKLFLKSAACVTLIAAAASASFYYYETSWEGIPYELGENLAYGSIFAGNSDYLMIISAGNLGGAWVRFYDGDGNNCGAMGIYPVRDDPYFFGSAFDSATGKGILVGYDYYEHYQLTSVLQHIPGWIDWPGYYIEGSIAVVPTGGYFYFYRDDISLSGFESAICKASLSSPSVVASFRVKPPVWDMEADNDGYLYAMDRHQISKYSTSGVLIGRWAGPGPNFIDVTIDAAGRVLALCDDNNTYVYSPTGVLLGSFTEAGGAPKGACMGPSGKYYVARDTPYKITVSRFAPSPTNIRPASLGKIKALFN